MNNNPPNQKAGSSEQRTSGSQTWPNMFFPNGQPLQSQGPQQQPTAQSYTSQMNLDSSTWGGPSGSYTNHSSSQPERSHQSGNPASVQPNDSVISFMQSMPTKNADPSQHALWTELVRMKTRTLELQIADAKAKEREAEAELLKLRQMYAQKGGIEDLTNAAGSTGHDVFGSLPMSTTGSSQYGQGGAGIDMYGQHTRNGSGTFGEVDTFAGSGTGIVTPLNTNGMDMNPQHAMTTFDLEAMMQHNNLDNLFSWLPDFGETPQANRVQGQGQIQGVDPNDLFGLGNNQSNVTFQTSITDTPRSVKPNITSPITRRSHTPDEDEPANKKIKRPEKKIVVEQSSECIVCAKPLAKIMVRAPKSNLPDQIVAQFTCTDCKPVAQPPSLSDMYGSGSGHGIGTVDTRKRLRMAMEADDEDKVPSDARRAFCDVCQRVFGSGMIAGGSERENMASISELVCTSCESKYSRCTDCGGGGGGRVGIGKWRMKQVFQPGRKTCSLSHTRLGDRPREIGVHVTPTDFTAEELKEVLARCKQLWNEKTLARLAVPEMLEIDLPSQMTNPIRDYADVEDIVTQNWPNRESMIRAEGADPNRFKRLLGLVWAHSKSRRGTRTVDIEEEWQKKGEGDDMSTVLENVKRTNLAIPGGSELIGMWGGEWDMKHGSLLVSTFIPFEGTDGEDSTALSVGEMISKVQMMRQSMNQERREVATKQGTQPDLVPQCEHLWVVSGGAMPLVRERIADILVRKRSFVHVDEYLTRHPDFANALSARPVGLHPDVLRPSPSSAESKQSPLILVRWLGKDFDAQKILEIKQAEFGGKGKLKKKAKK